MNPAPDLDPYLNWLRKCGVTFRVADALVRAPDHDGELIPDRGGTATLQLPGTRDIVEHRDPDGTCAADHASFMVAHAIHRAGAVRRGATVWEVGCGSGVLAVHAALLGAGQVIASDVSEDVVALARRTAEAAGVEVECVLGPLLEPFVDHPAPDLVISNLPHKPVPSGGSLPLSQASCEDGASLHVGLAQQAAGRLAPGAAVWFFLHSLPDPRALRAYTPAFDLRFHAWKRRWFQPGEYGALQEQFVERSRGGVSYVGEREGRRFLVAGIWEAVRR